MRIGIYARGISQRYGGVKEYILCMTKTIIKQLKEDDELFVLHNNPEKQFDNRQVTEILLNSSNKMMCDFVLAPRIFNKLNLDVIWFPKNVAPFFIKAKKVVTIHDLAYFMPEYQAYGYKSTMYMKRMIRSSCKRANRIVAISKNTKEDIKRILAISDYKISVIYEAADKKYFVVKEPEKIKAFKDKHNLPEKFILFTGALTPRKNIKRLILAFKEIKSDMHLIITGNGMRNNEEEVKLINHNPLISRTGHIDADEMIYLYNAAFACIYPSLYEGFGLPILEAQACGSPVICSNVSSMPEVGRDSVHYVDPNDTISIRKGITKVLGDDSYRQNLIAKGLENVQRFGWDKAARELLGLIKNEY